MPPVLALHHTPPLDLACAVAEFLADAQLRRLSPRTLEWYRLSVRLDASAPVWGRSRSQPQALRAASFPCTHRSRAVAVSGK